MTGQTGAKKGESLSCTAERFMRRPPCRPGVREGLLPRPRSAALHVRADRLCKLRRNGVTKVVFVRPEQVLCVRQEKVYGYADEGVFGDPLSPGSFCAV